MFSTPVDKQSVCCMERGICPIDVLYFAVKR